jgi:2-oxoglutarate ferredoxin oxidoreductase subunit gamma
MNHAAIMAGFGGQGILMIGNILAVAAIKQELNVTFFPAYGVEMRGGTANCTVTISDHEVGSPVTNAPHGVVAMNEPSVVKFGPRVREGGHVLINSSMAPDCDFQKEGVTVLSLPFNEIALKLGNARLTSMVALGAYAKLTGVIELKSLELALPDVLPEKAHKLIPANLEALKEGYGLAGK